MSVQCELCPVYLDDFIVLPTTLGDHIQHLTQFFVWICAAGLKLKASKCHLFQRCIHYLVHVISEKGIHTVPAKLLISGPHPRLWETSGPSWDYVTETEKQAFNTPKKTLMTAPILAYPDPKRLLTWMP